MHELRLDQRLQLEKISFTLSCRGPHSRFRLNSLSLNCVRLSKRKAHTRSSASQVGLRCNYMAMKRSRRTAETLDRTGQKLFPLSLVFYALALARI
jgi:hypothetical protein